MEDLLETSSMEIEADYSTDMCCLQRYVCSVFPGALTKPQQKYSLSTAEVHGIDGVHRQEHHGHILQKATVIVRGYGGGYR
jgi:hypothetical protein